MSSSILLAATAALSLFSSASAHFQIQKPVPITGSAPKDPLNPSGSDFPCHGADLSNIGSRTSMAVGSSQNLEFNLGDGANTAVHGGGSCQLSVTYETDQAKLKDPASWKKCTPGSDNVKCVNTFDFTVPEEVKDGDAIFAWTWFNSLGNREMYMNCAAVSISGGKDKLDELPSLFVANIGSVSGSCETEQLKNVEFPDPGKYV
ncbi:hypothetical protein P152DRAFT_394073, partial [Eremomyces bilateralis CBS 781.70]